MTRNSQVCAAVVAAVFAFALAGCAGGGSARYLNRLSDLLFVLARVLARASGHGETLWKHERRKR